MCFAYCVVSDPGDHEAVWAFAVCGYIIEQVVISKGQESYWITKHVGR